MDDDEESSNKKDKTEENKESAENLDLSKVNIIVGDNSMCDIFQDEEPSSPRPKGKYDDHTFCDSTITGLIRKCW